MAMHEGYRLLWTMFEMHDSALERLYLPFTNSLSMPIIGDPDRRPMMPGDTNMPASGVWGLPKNWRLEIARTSVICDRAPSPVTSAMRWALVVDLKDLYRFDQPIHGHRRILLEENRPFWFEALVPYGWDVGDGKRERMPSEGQPEDLRPEAMQIVARVKDYGGGRTPRAAEGLRLFSERMARAARPGVTRFWICLEGQGRWFEPDWNKGE